MFESLQKTSLKPFGLLLQGSGNLAALEVSHLRTLVEEHRLVVLRGFDSLGKDVFIEYARTWGPLLEWNFGEVLELEVADEPKNYLFTTGDVPLHWDGAFAKQEPNFQVFQCLKAPIPGSGGETVFCEATQAIEMATPEQRKRWEKISITYRTDKLAHYGGEITSKLVTTNPKTGTARLRFAEPPGPDTVDLNPLSLHIEGGNASLIDEMRNVLYSDENCYAHSWQDGDFLLADNFALLHGRRPFSAHSPRHIQRIHVL